MCLPGKGSVRLPDNVLTDSYSCCKYFSVFTDSLKLIALKSVRYYLNHGVGIFKVAGRMKRKDFKNSMLGYCKLILEKMSFSKKLFRKEYRKSLSYLNSEEQNELKRWLRGNG